MKTILATAYAVNPYRGSEDGMGWNFVMQIARFHKVVAITRANNRPHIEKYMAENPSALYENVRFLYFDLPYWMRFWKKGGRGAMAYYLMWQRGIVPFIKKQALEVDIVHNLNFHNDWTPSFLWKLNKPLVWGPIGHHPYIPSPYLKPYAFSYWAKDRWRWGVKKYFWHLSAALRKTRDRASHILCMSTGVPKVLGISANYSIVPSVATQDFGWNGPDKSSGKFTLISAGRFVPLKGFDLAIRAFAQFLDSLDASGRGQCELLVVSSGAEEPFLKSLAAALKVERNIRFVAWMERDQLMAQFKGASAFLFPSHEGAGMVVAEALSFGLPVVCLDNEGPGGFVNEACAIAVPHGSYEGTVTGLAQGIHKLYADAGLRKRMSSSARDHFLRAFHWDRRGEQLKTIYESL